MEINKEHNLYRYVGIYNSDTCKFLSINFSDKNYPPEWRDEPFVFSEADIYFWVAKSLEDVTDTPEHLFVIPVNKIYESDKVVWSPPIWSEAVKLVGGFL